jgi:hypothetical protein
MIIFIIVIAALVLFLLLMFRDFFKIEEFETCYVLDEKGDYTKYGNDIENWKELKLDEYKKYKARKISKKKVVRNSWYDLEDHIASASLSGIVLLGLIVISAICIFTHVSYSVERKEAEITEHIVELETNKQSLIKFYETGVAKDIDISSSGLPERIKEHNKDVSSFVTEVKTGVIDKKNPWLNWFVSPAYKNVDITRIENTYISLL